MRRVVRGWALLHPAYPLGLWPVQRTRGNLPKMATKRPPFTVARVTITYDDGRARKPARGKAKP